MLTPSLTAADNSYQYDMTTNTLTATLKWSYATNVQIVVTGLTVEDGYQLGCPGVVLNNMTGNWWIVANDIYVSHSSSVDYGYGVANEDGVAFNMFLDSGGGSTFTFSLRTPGGKEYTYTVNKSIVLDGNPENNFFAFKVNKDKFFDINGHTYVEMGDGLKWATMNVGATKPWENGNYFAWGETEAKDQYGPDNYIWWLWSWNHNEAYSIDKYNDEDNLTTLEPDDDAASKN